MRTPFKRHLSLCGILFLWIVTGITAQTRLDDSLALVGLYNSTGGAGWTVTWDLTQPLDSFYGVTLDYSLSEGRVVCLDLDGVATCSQNDVSGNGLNGNLPNLNLSKCKFIYLGKNSLTGAVPDFSLPELEHLYIYINDLTGTIPNFSGIPKLKELALGNNQLSGSLPNFNSLPQLEELWLLFNNLSDTIPDFNFIPKLKILYLNGNTIQGEIPNFNNLPNLRELRIAGNLLSGNIPDFDQIPNLTRLEANSNMLSGFLPDFSNFPNADWIEFKDNDLIGHIPDFSNMPNLKRLDLARNKLADSIPDFLNIPKLERTDLSGNLLTGTIPDFSNTPNLWNLELDRNMLTGSIPDFLNLSNLGRLVLADNNLTEAIPIFTNLPNLFYLRIDKNNFTFVDLANSRQFNENLCNSNAGNYIYNPQDSVCTQDTLLSISTGLPFTIDLQIDDTVTTSTYFWYKDGIPYDTTTVNELHFPSFQLGDTGVYHCQITNPHAPNLTLYSRAKVVEFGCPITISISTTNTTCYLGNGAATATATGGNGNYTYLWSNGATTPSIPNLPTGSYTLTVTDGTGCTATASTTISFTGQPAIEWQKSLGGSGADYAFSIQQTVDGGFIVAGYSISNNGDVTGNQGDNDYWIVKLDNVSNIEWQKSLGGSGDDRANSIQQTVDGGFIVAGSSNSNNGDVTGNQGNNDYWIVKLDNVGNIEWQKSLGGSSVDQATSIQQTVDGGFIVAGRSNSNNGDVTGNQGGTDYWIVKLDNVGNIEWQKSLGGSGTDYALSIQQTVDGGFIVAGYSISNNGDVTGNQGDNDYWIVKFDNIGNIEWQKSLGGSGDDRAYSILQTEDGGFIVAGYSSSNNGDVTGNKGGWDYWIVKLDNVGNIEWQKSLGGNGSDAANSIQQTVDGGFIVAGYSGSNNGDVTGNKGGWDYWIVKLDNVGNIEWQKSLGGSGFDQARSIQQTVDGGFIVTGYSSSNNGDVTGNQGSYDYWIVKLNQPDPINSNFTSVNPSCSASNGTITISTSGSVQPYTFIWSTGDTTTAATGLQAGIYTVTVTDVNGCSIIESDTLNSFGVSLSSNITGNLDVTCKNQSNGSATIATTGGTPPYNYLWSNTETTPTAIALSAGLNIVTITDTNGCYQVDSITISEPDELSISSITGINASCNTSSNGSATATTTGGTPPYNYQWSNNATTQTVSNLSTGTYTVTVTDTNSCTGTSTITITEPSPLITSIIATNTVCTACVGQADATILGGTPPYTYLWSNAATTEDLTGLCAGTYSLTITDNNGCLATASTVITSTNTFSGQASINSQITCNGGCDGSASAAATGGQSPYFYQWGNGTSTTMATGLCSGTYQVTVSDVNGCQEVVGISLTEPSVLTSKALITNPITCNASNNGAITTTTTGGTPPYNHQWSNGNTTSTITGLTANTYTVTITDTNNCTTTNSIQLTEPPAITSNIALASAISCAGESNGSASITAQGGTLPFTYQWANGANTTTATGLSAGLATVTITDNNGCTQTNSITITEPSIVTISIPVTTNATCGNCDGTASITATGGTGTYSYNWSSGQTGMTVSGLCAGSHLVSVTDANGCETTQAVNISNSSGPSLDTVVSSASNCTGGTGSLDISIIGGTPPIQFSIDGGVTFQPDSLFTGLLSGIYAIQVVDANNCLIIASDTIQNLLSPTIDTVHFIEAICGDPNGAIQIFTTGGNPPIEYSIDNGATFQPSDSFGGLSQGVYEIVVQDAAGCVSTWAADTIHQHLGPAFAFLQGVSNSTCGQADGQIKFIYNGGTPPLQFSIDGGTTWQPADSFLNLYAGTYDLAIIDANGCDTFKNNVVLPDEPGPDITNISTSNPTCSQQNGVISVATTSGTPPLLFSINNGVSWQASNLFTSLSTNSYSIMVEDGNGCRDTSQQITLTDPGAPTIDSLTVVNPSACGGPSGNITIHASGGTGQFLYEVNGTFYFNNNIPNQPIGTYAITVFDSLGCSVDTTIVLVNGNGVTIDSVLVQESSCGMSNGVLEILVSGGNSPYQYSTDGGTAYASVNIFQTLYAGTYTVIVKDDDNCSDTTIVELDDLTPVIDSITSVPSDCDIDNGSLTAYISNGLPPYTYLWNTVPAQSTPSATGLPLDTFQLIVTDDTGCAVTVVGNVDEPLELNKPDGDHFVCGTPYVILGSDYIGQSFIWSTGETTNTISVNQAGEYNVTVTDLYNCLFVDTVEVNQIPFNPQVSADTTIVIGDIAFLEASGGTTYNWWPTTDLDCTNCPNPVATPSDTTEYFVEIDIPTGCPDTLSVLVYAVESLDETVIVPDVITPNGDGVNDEWIIVNIDKFPLNRVFIVNRWGDVVYEATPYNNDWAGTYNGKLLPQGTYYYYVELDVNQVDTRKGSITLIR